MLIFVLTLAVRFMHTVHTNRSGMRIFPSKLEWEYLLRQHRSNIQTRDQTMSDISGRNYSILRNLSCGTGHKLTYCKASGPYIPTATTTKTTKDMYWCVSFQNVLRYFIVNGFIYTTLHQHDIFLFNFFFSKLNVSWIRQNLFFHLYYIY